MPKRLLAAIFSALLAACTVGPRHRVPEMPLPEQFDQARSEATVEPVGSKLWSGFGSVELDALIARSLEANTTIAQAAARLAETRALSGLSIYSLFPTVTAAAGRERAQISGGEPFAPPGGLLSDTHRAGFDASWEIDLFGGLRSENRAIRRRA
ncbi:MAG: efflux transporter outer membrane subunit, partial [Steroidobacteraceae bacterium]